MNRNNYIVKQLIISLGLVTTLCLLTGCGGSIWMGNYYPQCVSIPLIEERGDVHLEGGIGHISAAGGLTENIAMQFFSRSHGRWMDNQVALGWYKPIGAGVFEIYGGYGNSSGIASHWYGDDPDIIYYDIGFVSQYFTQINYGWNNLGNSHISIAGAVKTGLLSSGIMSMHTASNYGPASAFSGDMVYNRGFFLEPYLTFCFGWKQLKFNIKAGYELVRPETMKGFNKPKLMLDVGINYNFNILSSKKNKK